MTDDLARENVLIEVLQNLRRVPMPTLAWLAQRREDFRLGVYACLNVLHRMLGTKEMTKLRGFAQDGYSQQQLQEGAIRKGGQNAPQSQVHTRPPAPAPLRPAQSSSQGSSNQSDGNSQICCPWQAGSRPLRSGSLRCFIHRMLGTKEVRPDE